jgi:hypothetical protein
MRELNHSERTDATFTRAMKTLAEIESAAEPSSRVEAAVMAGWDASHHRLAGADRSRTRRFVRGAATTAAGITLAGVLMWQRGTHGPDGADNPSPPAAGVTVQDAGGGRFTTVAVVGGPLVAGEPIRVVRMRVARSALGELGIPSAGQAETVDIEVLVGEDGVARGVRVPISES